MKLIRINYSTLWKESSIQLILDQELAILRRHEVNFTRKRMRNLIERNTFASENQRSGVSDATQ